MQKFSAVLLKGSWLLWLAGILCLITVAEATPPNLKPRDVRLKMCEILRHHATQKRLDGVIVARSLENFLEELDPAKTYLTQAEIERWLHPSEELIRQIQLGFQIDQYGEYEQMYARIANAIERRHQIEEEIDALTLPSNVSDEDLINPTWAKNVEELRQRLITLRALQVESIAKICDEAPTRLLQRLAKRRCHREANILGASPDERQRLMLAYVLKATAGALDAQTAYFTPEEATNFVNDLQRRLYGIGVQLRDSLNGFTVIQVIEGGPAGTTNALQANDRIIGVNGESIVGLDILDAVGQIRGPADTPVRLTVVRDQTPFDVTITRGEVVVQESRIESKSEQVEGGVIGHISLHSFYQDGNNSSAEDMKQAIDTLQSDRDVVGIVLDLRYNVGGLLPQAIDVTGLFIKKGIVASIKDSDGYVRHLRHLGDQPVWDGPLLVLVSRGSASASEIVAQALQDYGRALIVGDPQTFGKGTFQTSSIDAIGGRYINPKGEYKVTRGIYYTVSGKSPQLTGVEADIAVPGCYSELELGERYSKFPLQPDSIQENFVDNLTDVSFTQRYQLLTEYRPNQQQRLTCYTAHLEELRTRSQKRLATYEAYQAFLTALKEPIEADELDYEQKDFQLIEAFHIIQDLVSLVEQQSVKAA